MSLEGGNCLLPGDKSARLPIFLKKKKNQDRSHPCSRIPGYGDAGLLGIFHYIFFVFFTYNNNNLYLLLGNTFYQLLILFITKQAFAYLDNLRVTKCIKTLRKQLLI